MIESRREGDEGRVVGRGLGDPFDALEVVVRRSGVKGGRAEEGPNQICAESSMYLVMLT